MVTGKELEQDAIDFADAENNNPNNLPVVKGLVRRNYMEKLPPERVTYNNGFHAFVRHPHQHHSILLLLPELPVRGSSPSKCAVFSYSHGLTAMDADDVMKRSKPPLEECSFTYSEQQREVERLIEQAETIYGVSVEITNKRTAAMVEERRRRFKEMRVVLENQ